MKQATQVRGESSCGGAVSEGGIGEGVSAGESQQKWPKTPSAAPQQRQQQPQEPEQPSSARWLHALLGEAGIAKVGATMLSQQETLQQQVPCPLITSLIMCSHGNAHVDVTVTRAKIVRR